MEEVKAFSETPHKTSKHRVYAFDPDVYGSPFPVLFCVLLRAPSSLISHLIVYIDTHSATKYKQRQFMSAHAATGIAKRLH